MAFEPYRKRGGPMVWQQNAEQRQPPTGYEAVVQPGFSRQTLLADLERAFRNLHNCNNWHRCLHADLLDGKHAVDLQLTVEDSDPIDSPDLNGGSGIDISVSSSDITFALDITGLTAVTPVSADQFAFADASDSNNPKKVTLTDLATALTSSVDHGGLTGLGDNDHTQYASTPAGTGMAAITSGSQALTARTLTASEGVQVANGDGAAAAPAFKLDVNGLTTDSSPDALDTFPFYDTSEGVHNKLTLASLSTAIGTAANMVTAASTFANDNRLLRSDGTSRGAQASAATMDDSGNLSGVGTIASGAHTITQAGGGLVEAYEDDGTNGYRVYLDEVQTTDATATTVIEIARPSASATICVEYTITAVNTADTTQRAVVTGAQEFYDNSGTLTAGTAHAGPNYSDTITSGILVSPSVNGSNWRIRVRGVAATTINWSVVARVSWRNTTT